MSGFKILITGARGQLGSECAGLLSPNNHVLAVDVETLDISDPGQVQKVAGGFHPQWIINCAAYTQVDDCEKNEALAFAVNAKGPENLALWASANQAKLLHVSTDYVFDGAKPPPQGYSEQDPTHPLSVYGRSKLEGERAVSRHCSNAAIVRTAWLYGQGPNFLKTMLRLALTSPEKAVRVVDDQFGCPTQAWDLARQIKAIIDKDLKGIVHAVTHGHTTWYALALTFLEKLKVNHNIVPCATDQYPTAAVRPKNSILINQRLGEKGIDIMPPWEDALDAFVGKNRETLLSQKH